MKNYPLRRGNSIGAVLATLALVVVLACGVIYAMGYATVENSSDKTTIEVNTQQMKEDADQAVESGKQMLNDAGKSIEDGAEEVQDQVDGDSEPETEVNIETEPAPVAPPADNNDATATIPG
ncbi:hypothetical protein [Blastopirellula marina]|uniref:Uncharacterized protein n=1 Tax=Blastopirellula marina DSM 3645 TaxID=314230 RepID=A3ZS54_9BACT|nr:hypothetical protein [Blastopirellula marina]EAQ80512.1 hypothetical protein DSM3645_14240 [Blastopirellula marina DSM 3645]